MTKAKNFVASCLLIVSMSAVAFADGGETQGPANPLTTPPPVVQPVVAPTETESSQTFDALKTAEAITVWLLTAIL